MISLVPNRFFCRTKHYFQESFDENKCCGHIYGFLRSLLGISFTFCTLMPLPPAHAIGYFFSYFCESNGPYLIAVSGSHSKTIYSTLCKMKGNVDAVETRSENSADVLQSALKKKSYRAVICSHVEPETGVLSPIDEIASICKDSGIVLLADLSYSAGVEDLGFVKRFAPGIVLVPSWEGLESEAGISSLLVSEEAARQLKVKGLASEGKILLSDRNFNFSSLLLSEFESGLSDVVNQGVIRRIKRFRKVASIIDDSLERMGFEICAKGGSRASSVTVIKHGGVRITDLVAFMKSKYELELLEGTLFDRFAECATAFHSSTLKTSLGIITGFLFGLEDFLRNSGFDIPFGISLQSVKSITDFCG